MVQQRRNHLMSDPPGLIRTSEKRDIVLSSRCVVTMDPKRQRPELWSPVETCGKFLRSIAVARSTGEGKFPNCNRGNRRGTRSPRRSIGRSNRLHSVTVHLWEQCYQSSGEFPTESLRPAKL